MSDIQQTFKSNYYNIIIIISIPSINCVLYIGYLGCIDCIRLWEDNELWAQ
jgi:hypothetical protein